jgi:hypothetical protein
MNTMLSIMFAQQYVQSMDLIALTSLSIFLKIVHKNSNMLREMGASSLGFFFQNTIFHFAITHFLVYVGRACSKNLIA